MPLICVKSLLKWFHHLPFQRGCHSLQNLEYIITPFLSWCCFSRLHSHRCMQHDTCQSIAFKCLFPLCSTFVQKVPVFSHLSLLVCSALISSVCGQRGRWKRKYLRNTKQCLFFSTLQRDCLRELVWAKLFVSLVPSQFSHVRGRLVSSVV